MSFLREGTAHDVGQLVALTNTYAGSVERRSSRIDDGPEPSAHRLPPRRSGIVKEPFLDVFDVGVKLGRQAPLNFPTDVNAKSAARVPVERKDKDLLS